MKEIGKLIELLNEYQNKYVPDYPIRASEETINSGREILISKRYGFIKWLVENEKIEREKFQEPKIRGIIGLISNWHNSEGKSYKDYSKELAYESLLMLLSISSSPIDDLISYLR